MRNGRVDMLSGSIAKGLFAMTIPIMITNVMQMLFNIIDMTVLGMYANDTAVGAVGACGSLITLSTGLLVGCSSGSNVTVARHLGEHDFEKARKAMGTALLFSIIGGVILAVIGITNAGTFLSWINCPGKLLPQATTYFKIYFWGIPVMMFHSFAISLLRATGETKRPMYYLLTGGVIKVLLTIFFVKYLHLGVASVAIATIISNTVTIALSMSVLLRHRGDYHFTLKDFKIDFNELKAILYIGVPTGLQTALYSLANTVIVTAVNGFGAEATTGIAIANQFDGVLYQIIHAPSIAVMPYVAQNIGAGNVKRAKETVWKAIFITVAVGGTVGFFSSFFSAELSSIMTSNPEIIKYSQQKMIIVSSTYFICGINDVMGGVLRGMGKPIYSTVSTLVFMCLLRFVWVYAIFPFVPNMTFLYLVWPIGWILSIITLVIIYIPTVKKFQIQMSKEAL